MSINDFINKIKGYQTIDKTTIMYLFILSGVGVLAFSLGRLSVSFNNANNISTIVSGLDQTASAITSFENQPKSIPTGNSTQTEGKYLASKNGKMYYAVGCSGSKRISAKNIVWFNTQADAEKEGYKFSSSCKK